MRNVFSILFFVVALVGCGQAGPVRGMTVTSWSRGEYASPAARQAFQEVAALGLGWTAITPTSYQTDVDDAGGPIITAQTPTFDDVRAAIATSHGLGMRVLLKPHVDLSAPVDPGDWRGQIGRDFAESDWSAWFAAYEEWIAAYAELAQAEHVDALSVGTELDVASTRTSDWRRVIARVRSLYAGKLVFAASGGAFDQVAFWDALDWIGVDAYYELSTATALPSVGELVAGWQPHVNALAALSRSWGRPLVLTEVGFRSVDGAWRSPWDCQSQAAPDAEAQRRLYEATARAFSGASWLRGFFVWDWPIAEAGGSGETGYSPRGKPAAQELSQLLSASPRGE